MPGEHQSVSDIIDWLSLPRHAYPNFYLNRERIGHRFRSYLGSIREFSESVEKSGEANASVKALFLEAVSRAVVVEARKLRGTSPTH